MYFLVSFFILFKSITIVNWWWQIELIPGICLMHAFRKYRIHRTHARITYAVRTTHVHAHDYGSVIASQIMLIAIDMNIHLYSDYRSDYAATGKMNKLYWIGSHMKRFAYQSYYLNIENELFLNIRVIRALCTYSKILNLVFPLFMASFLLSCTIQLSDVWLIALIPFRRVN